MTTPSTFRKADITRACKAALQAGLKVAEVRCPPEGGFIITVIKDNETKTANPWDEDDET